VIDEVIFVMDDLDQIQIIERHFFTAAIAFITLIYHSFLGRPER